MWLTFFLEGNRAYNAKLKPGPCGGFVFWGWFSDFISDRVSGTRNFGLRDLRKRYTDSIALVLSASESLMARR